MSIFVTREIPVSMERLWELTQTPALHQRWDLRFSRIEYLPRKYPGDPQEFTYETRIGLGLAIRGTGTTRGERNVPDGSHTSSLVFGSADRLSLIRKGSGYWRYEPTPRGVRFTTRYDYAVRWGWIGWLADRLLFRPLMAWATAWSFDRLARWAVAGIPPEESLRTSAGYAVARGALAAVWIYQGLVPKLLGPHANEVAMTLPLGLSLPAATRLVLALGVVEVLLGLLILSRWQDRWPAYFSILAMPVAGAVAALSGAEVFRAPFNVAVINGMVMALAAVVALLAPAAVTASNCRWSAYGPPAADSGAGVALS